MIAPSPGPLSKRFSKTIDAILRRDDIWVDNKDSDIVVVEGETSDVVGEKTESVIAVQEDIAGVVEDNAEGAVADDVILNEPPGNILVKEEPAEEVAVVEEDDIDIEESSDIASGADTDFATPEKVAETVAEEVEDDIVYYKDAQVEYEFVEMRKENGVYFVPLRKPVLIQTPVIKLLESISGVSTNLRVSGGFAKFVKNHEKNMLNLVKENKTLWFKNDIEDSALDSGFKSFLEADTLKVKISDDFAAFDTAGDFIDSTFCTPAEVRCILKISGVWFGSAEFGSIMSLVQTQLAKLPKCSIKPTRERKKYNYEGEFA